MAMDAVLKQFWAPIIEVTNCACELIHHAKKMGGFEVTADSARGAVAVIGAARSAVALNGMTQNQANKANVENRHLYFWATDAKANMVAEAAFRNGASAVPRLVKARTFAGYAPHTGYKRWVGVANDNARLDIHRAGVGGRHSFNQAWTNAGLYPACRVPRFVTGIANGMELMGYRIHSNSHAAQGSVEGGHDLNARTIVETMDQTRIDSALGMHAKVLDLSIAGLTAKQIAVKLGWGSTKAAERRATAAQDAALAALAAVEAKLAA